MNKERRERKSHIVGAYTAKINEIFLHFSNGSSVVLGMAMYVRAPLWFKLKCLNYWMDRHEIVYRHLWSIYCVPTAGQSLHDPVKYLNDF